MGMILNTTGCDEHVAVIESYIRTVKERVWVNVNTLPFEKYPHPMKVEMLYNAVLWKNCLPHKSGIHATLRTQAIETGSHLDYYKHFKIQFDFYVQLLEQHNNLPRT